jgi:hypothetical protein
MVLCACQPHPSIASVENRTPEHIQRCGDGKCEGPESPQNCPTDCLSEAELPDQREALIEPTPERMDVKDQRPLLYLGLMVHLEGWGDDLDQEKFEQHARLVREYADLFERYGAKLTLESKELTDGSIRWGDNILLEMEQRGHGIGVHADIGGSRTYDCSRFVSDLRAERLQLETLGVQVRHVSGNTSHCDWVRATIKAGYEFTSGTVAYNVMSMPIELRPEQYRDCPTPAQCHEVYPPDLEDRLHPWRTSDGSNWLEHDPQGELVILASDGGLNCIQEEMEGGVTSPCVFDIRDTEFIEGQIDRALALATTDEVNFIYFSWSLGKPLDQEILETLLQRVEPYIEDGRVAWATLPEIYDAYLAWELGN